jgi:aspartate/tyrosine/aromatic aminotransferase
VHWSQQHCFSVSAFEKINIELISNKQKRTSCSIIKAAGWSFIICILHNTLLGGQIKGEICNMRERNEKLTQNFGNKT